MSLLFKMQKALLTFIHLALIFKVRILDIPKFSRNAKEYSDVNSFTKQFH